MSKPTEFSDKPVNHLRIPETDDRAELLACCCETIKVHVLYNPMMVCTTCKQIIKCFADHRAFKNYITFCNTRRRKVSIGKVDEYYTVVFQSYDQR